MKMKTFLLLLGGIEARKSTALRWHSKSSSKVTRMKLGHKRLVHMGDKLIRNSVTKKSNGLPISREVPFCMGCLWKWTRIVSDAQSSEPFLTKKTNEHWYYSVLLHCVLWNVLLVFLFTIMIMILDFVSCGLSSYSSPFV